MIVLLGMFAVALVVVLAMVGGLVWLYRREGLPLVDGTKYKMGYRRHIHSDYYRPAR